MGIWRGDPDGPASLLALVGKGPAPGHAGELGRSLCADTAAQFLPERLAMLHVEGEFCPFASQMLSAFAPFDFLGEGGWMLQGNLERASLVCPRLREPENWSLTPPK